MPWYVVGFWHLHVYLRGVVCLLLYPGLSGRPNSAQHTLYLWYDHPCAPCSQYAANPWSGRWGSIARNHGYFGRGPILLLDAEPLQGIAAPHAHLRLTWLLYQNHVNRCAFPVLYYRTL